MPNQYSKRTFTNANQEVVEYNGEPVSWRISAYALIVKDDSLLIIKNKNEKLYDIPGGGIEEGELIAEALERELMEESGAKAKIGALIHIEEDFFKHARGDFYQTIQLYYLGELSDELTTPADARIEFVGVVPISELAKYPLPKAVLNAIEKMNSVKLKKIVPGVDKIKLNVA
jgi:ADP-ribose pyrophosphatase YjhB (NUDIX family)